MSPSSSPPPEPADPLRVWFRFLRLSQRLVGAVSAELKPLGLSIPQFDLISTLTEREGISQQELAERLYVTKGNVSGLVDRLVEAGLVERRSLPNDRRSHALHLTERGRELARQGMAAQTAYVHRTLGTLPPSDIAELDRIVRAWREEARMAEEARKS